ncbi:hypothetical protein [Phycicoccus avicenniae]|uniref:hypothetical protein n=1 Tax=Phycicoccus avicenniae TaxID=2828860 RepID=UPI003D2A44B1
MSHDVFEDELRARLLGATESESHAFHDIDTTEVLGSGRRIVRRRRMAAVGGTLAAVTVLGVGSWAVLDGTTDRAVQEVPATRVSPGRIVEATLPGPDDATYAVRFDKATGSAVTVYRKGGTTATALVGRQMREGVGAAWGKVSDAPFVVLGVVPNDTSQMMYRFDGGDLGGTSTTDDVPLPGTGFKAFVITSEKAPGDATLSGLDYAVGGRVFAADGTEVPSATVDGRTVYVDEDADEIGLVEPDGSATRPLSLSASGGRPHLATSRGATGSALVTTTAVIVPIGAQDVAVEVAAGATLRSSTSAPLLGGSGLAVIAVSEGPEKPMRGVTRVTWTVDGQAGSWTNPD